MYVLCVIDMQDEFEVAADSRVGINVQREIQLAISDDAHVLFVEYNGSGDTLPELTRLTKTTSKAHTVIKTGDDGSKAIVAALKEYDIPNHHLKIVGVNTDYCVYRTVHGLRRKLPFYSQIEVIADACDSQWSHVEGLTNLHALGVMVSNDTFTGAN